MRPCPSAPSSRLLPSARCSGQRPTGAAEVALKLLRVASVLLCCASVGSFADLPASRPARDGKLIVVSTGTQLKLYPLSDTYEVSAHKYYVLRPRPAGTEPTDRQRPERPRDVAPSKAFITNLDAFVDPRFCPNGTATCDSCLVVVWFDQADRAIHYGSVDLSTMQPQGGHENASTTGAKTDQPTLARQVDRFLHLDEFRPPVDLCKTCNVLSLVVDKVRLRVYYAINDTRTAAGSRSIRSVQLSTPRGALAPHDSDFVAQGDRAVGSLIVDELGGSSLYYLDDNTKARRVHMGSRAPFGRDLELNASTRRDQDVSPAKVAGLTWSTRQQRFYWLTDSTNEIYSSDVTGGNVARIGAINSKPLVRSVDKMHLLGDMLFVSDSIKKSIISYGLGRADNSTHNDTDPAARHRVVLVEMPTVLDFKPIDLGEVYLINGLSCFDDDETQFCTRSFRSLNGTQWQQQKYASSSNFACDAMAVDWKQAVASKQLGVTNSQQSITPQREPSDEMVDPELTFDLRSLRPQDGGEKHLFLWQSVGARHPISMQYICCGSIVAVVVVIVLLLVAYVIKFCLLRAKQHNQPNKRHTIGPYLSPPSTKIDKRPLVSIIDCETSSTYP